MRSHLRFGSLIISLAIGGMLSGCFSSTKRGGNGPRACPCGASAASRSASTGACGGRAGLGCESNNYLNQLG